MRDTHKQEQTIFLFLSATIELARPIQEAMPV